jgi:hypothetical protein
VLETFTEVVRAKSIDGRPNNCTGSVEQKKARPRHLIDPGQESSQNPQERDEATEKNDFATVAQE